MQFTSRKAKRQCKTQELGAEEKEQDFSLLPLDSTAFFRKDRAVRLNLQFFVSFKKQRVAERLRQEDGTGPVLQQTARQDSFYQ